MNDVTVILIAAVIAAVIVYVQWLDREKDIQLHNLMLAVNAIMEALEEQEKLIEEIGKKGRGQWQNNSKNSK